ncbi:co-regulatory protein PtrA N-terminal domain-containing protein, partial [Klebsiella pneumoniae]|uniref:co-regulatory protein PtrA N-terminal domain-containing protein n=1 Tax=Klebsiella pneumoniae TaxID=573 RepID=UPI00351F092E
MKPRGAGEQIKRSCLMNRLKALFFVSSILISASALAEGGADRILERMESLRDKAEATLVQAEKA